MYLVFIFGCATTTFNIPTGQSLEKRTVIRDYEIGKQKTVSTGSVMVEKKEGVRQYILSVTSAKGVSYAVPSGNTYGYHEFSFWNPASGVNFDSPVRLMDTAQVEAISAYKEGKSDPVVFRITDLDFWYNAPAKGEPVPANELVIEEQIAEADGLMFQLIYNGLRGENTIILTYREFINNFVRPAYHQELYYDLKKSNIISFKDYVIKIVKTTNNEIVFIVEEE